MELTLPTTASPYYSAKNPNQSLRVGFISSIELDLGVRGRCYRYRSFGRFALAGQ